MADKTVDTVCRVNQERNPEYCLTHQSTWPPTQRRCCVASNCELTVEKPTATEATFDPGLSPAQYERLALLAEELGEVVQIVGKILRHGYESRNPMVPAGAVNDVTNRRLLQKELGDVQCAVTMLCDAGDVDRELVDTDARIKRMTVARWLHHQ